MPMNRCMGSDDVTKITCTKALHRNLDLHKPYVDDIILVSQIRQTNETGS